MLWEHQKPQVTYRFLFQNTIIIYIEFFNLGPVSSVPVNKSSGSNTKIPVNPGPSSSYKGAIPKTNNFRDGKKQSHSINQKGQIKTGLPLISKGTMSNTTNSKNEKIQPYSINSAPNFGNNSTQSKVISQKTDSPDVAFNVITPPEPNNYLSSCKCIFIIQIFLAHIQFYNFSVSLLSLQQRPTLYIHQPSVSLPTTAQYYGNLSSF